MDIKPYSCPNSINVNNSGIVTIGIGTNEHTYDKDNVEGYPVDEVFGSVTLSLEKDGSVIEGPITVYPERYEYVDNGLVLNPCPSGDSFTGAGYLLKFRTEELLPLFGNHVGEKDLYLRLKAGYLHDDSYLFNTRDSVSLISNNK